MLVNIIIFIIIITNYHHFQWHSALAGCQGVPWEEVAQIQDMPWLVVKVIIIIVIIVIVIIINVIRLTIIIISTSTPGKTLPPMSILATQSLHGFAAHQ